MTKRILLACAFGVALGLCSIPKGVWAGLPNGISSGDVRQNSAVLWARATAQGPVTFEYSTTPDWSANVFSTTLNAPADPLQPLKLPISGLVSGTDYFYRVTNGGETLNGRFRTSAAPGTMPGLRFGVASDWQQAPTYPVLKNVPGRNLEFLAKLGDTIYADLETPALPGVSQARTLQDFRTKHAEISLPRTSPAPTFTLNTVRDLQATTPILATIDDHEIVDNFAGGARPGESPDAPDIGSSQMRLFTDGVGATIGNAVPPTAQFVNETFAYRDALQAYSEYHAIRDEVWSGTGDPRMENKLKLYRHNTYGGTASMTMLDSRSFRDAQIDPITDIFNPTAVQTFYANAFDPTRTLLGESQLNQLKSDLLANQRAGVVWKFVTIPEPIQNFGVANAEDRFEGYAAERTELLAFIQQAGIENVVFLSGDFHGNIVNDLSYQVPTMTGLQSVRTNAIEIVTGPVAFFDGRFGPSVANLAASFGLVTPAQLAFYQSLPIAEDADSIPNDKDDFIKGIVNAQIDAFYDENPIGLADSPLVVAELLQGDYLSSHRFTWAEFEIEPGTNALTVSIWGIDAYSEAQMVADPAAIESLVPRIVSQFRMTPVPEPHMGGIAALCGLWMAWRGRAKRAGLQTDRVGML